MPQTKTTRRVAAHVARIIAIFVLTAGTLAGQPAGLWGSTLADSGLPKCKAQWIWLPADSAAEMLLALKTFHLREAPERALLSITATYKWRKEYGPSRESYSLRSCDLRSIWYENGMEEQSDTNADPYEWDNLADKPEHTERFAYFRTRLQARLPKPGIVPPQPAWEPKNSK